MRASSKCLRVESSGVAPTSPSSTSDTSVEAFVDPAVVVVVVPSPST